MLTNINLYFPVHAHGALVKGGRLKRKFDKCYALYLRSPAFPVKFIMNKLSKFQLKEEP